MLNFVLGLSGSGKTEYLYNLFCEKAANGNGKLLFVVPDQCTFETETAFLERLGAKLCQNIKVLGFSRLCDYVFEQIGHCNFSFADEGIRHVVMSIAIDQVQDKLVLFKKRASSFDLTDLMLNAVKEYKKCAITTDMLYMAANETSDDVLSQKLKETAVVYDAYEAIMSNSYIDPLDSLTKVSKLLLENNIFEDYMIAIDSYYGFTSQEYEVLSSLMTGAEEIYFSLTTDGLNTTDTDLFFVCNRTKSRLLHIAKEKGIAVAAPVVLQGTYRFASEDLSAVQSNIFRIDKNPYDKESDNVLVYCAQSIYDEADFVARNIKRLVVEEGYRYSDIAIVSRNCDKYIGILDTVLDKYDISYFMDKPQDIDSKPLLKLVMLAFDVINSGFDKDSILSLLKTGLTDFSVDEIADFENYIFTWDINSKSFLKEFTANPRGFSDEFTDNDAQVLNRVENVRKSLVSRLLTFSNACKDATGLEISKALMNLLYSLNCPDNINRLCDFYEAENNIGLSQELIRIWNILSDILDKMVSVIGDYRISAKRYSELLHTYFTSTEISFIPRGIDQVDVASADRAHICGKKAVFVIGAIDGEFPHTPVEAGVFTDNERKSLRMLKLSVSDTLDELFFTEKFLAYTALCSASDKLFVSMYYTSLNGDGKNASSVITEVISAVPKIKVLSYDDVTFEEHLWSQRAAFDFCTENYKSRSLDFIKLRSYFENNDEYSTVIKAINSSINREPARIKDTLLAKKLFKTNMTLSASQVDKFHLCKFSYFCRYGLSVKERRQASIDALEYGTLMHYVLENFIKNHRVDDLSNISRETVSVEVSGLLDEYIKIHLGGTSDKSQRFIYLFYRMKSVAVNLICHIIDELSQSQFKPVDFELNIGADIPAYTLNVENGVSVKICGSVDRVDVLHQNGKNYIRVIDYKTGNKKFNLSDVLYGINLQMLIYMSAINKNGALRFGESIMPAGVLYMPAVSPMINAAFNQSEESINQKRLKEYTMHGIILDDTKVISSMEKDTRGIYIPVSCSGDTVTKGKDNLATLEQLGALFSKVDDIIGSMALTLLDGDVSAVPAKGEYDACAWCPYLSVCTHKEDDACKKIVKMKKDDFYKEIEIREGRKDEQSMDSKPESGN